VARGLGIGAIHTVAGVLHQIAAALLVAIE